MNPDRDSTMLKPTLLLATALFLVCAPAPDAKVIAELSANFIVTNNHAARIAAEPELVKVSLRR